MNFRLLDFTGSGNYRSLFAWEYGLYAEHLLRLPPRDRRTRFTGSVGDAYVRAHARSTLSSARTKVIGWFQGGILRGAAELCWNSDETAEAAFTIEPLYRKQGIGTSLATRLLRAAKNRGKTRITILTEADNIAMRRLGARLGAKFVVEGRDVEGTLATGTATLLSVVFEIAEEQRAFANKAMLPWLRGFAPRLDNPALSRK